MKNNTTTVENGKAERLPSKSSTVKGFKTNIKNLKTCGLINDEDFKKLTEIHKKVMKQWIGEEIF